MNDVLQNLFETRCVCAEDGIPQRLHSAISVEEGRFIQDIIGTNKPSICLEIGCAFGVSSLFICEALREAGGSRHIIIDPFQNDPSSWNGIGLLNLARAGYRDLVEFHGQRSFECLPRMLEGGVRVDFAFIDGMHTFDYVLIDFFFVDKLLNVGGIIVFDDYGWPSIRKACRYIVTNLPYQCIGPSSGVEKRSVKRRVAEAAASTYPFSRCSKEELRRPNHVLGLPNSINYVALKKMADDNIGKEPECNRCWDTHMEF